MSSVECRGNRVRRDEIIQQMSLVDKLTGNFTASLLFLFVPSSCDKPFNFNMLETDVSLYYRISKDLEFRLYKRRLYIQISLGHINSVIFISCIWLDDALPKASPSEYLSLWQSVNNVKKIVIINAT